MPNRKSSYWVSITCFHDSLKQHNAVLGNHESMKTCYRNPIRALSVWQVFKDYAVLGNHESMKACYQNPIRALSVWQVFKD